MSRIENMSFAITDFRTAFVRVCRRLFLSARRSAAARARNCGQLRRRTLIYEDQLLCGSVARRMHQPAVRRTGTARRNLAHFHGLIRGLGAICGHGPTETRRSILGIVGNRDALVAKLCNSPAQHILNVVPLGTMAETARPVVITHSASNNLRDCEVQARAQLPESLYDKPKGREVEVGGLKAVAVHAHTRCRNATPTGIAICIPHRSIGYVVTNRIVGCRTVSGNPFSGSDWFDDLINGIRFAP